MGKGTIISHDGDGLYTVTVRYDTSGISTAISTLEGIVTELDAVINDPESTEREVLFAKIRKLSAQKRIDYLSSRVPYDKTASAWCVDLTRDLSGNVGTIEIARNKDKGLLIQPGFEGNASYDQIRDGRLVPTMAMSPVNSFVNLGFLPGMQKWAPGYRTGTITAIDYGADTCDVSLNSVASSQQGLNVNQASSLSGVPVEYMTCNSAAFVEGDDVVVKFQNYDWSQPTVIGFPANPKACSRPPVYVYRVYNDGYMPSIYGYSEYFPDLHINRIIVWKLGYDGDGFVPGGGYILLDVDIASNTVYPATNDWTDAEQIALASDYISGLSYTENMPTDVAGDWFNTGLMSNPGATYRDCVQGTGVDDSEGYVEAKVHEYHDGDDGGRYRVMIPPAPVSDYLEGWRELYCPEYGGSPEFVYNALRWSELDENGPTYPESEYPPWDENVEWQYCYTTQDGFGRDWAVLSHNCGGGSWISEEDFDFSIMSGRFWTPDDSAGGYDLPDGFKNASFFCYKHHPYGNGGIAYDVCTTGPDPDPPYNCDYNQFYIGVGSGFLGNGIVTPIETIDYEEILYHYFDLAPLCPTSNGCASRAGIFGSYRVINMGDELDLTPCELPYPDSRDDGIRRDVETIWERTEFGFLIPSPAETGCNHAALYGHIEAGMRSTSAEAAEVGTIGEPDYQSGWGCIGDGSFDNPETFYGDDWEDVPSVYNSPVGVFLYIFAPDAFWWVDPVTEEIMFWDIHSCREASPEEINSYRVLDFEEHITSILGGIKDTIDTTDDIRTVYVAGGQYPLSGTGYDAQYTTFHKHYGFELKQGFCNELNAT